MGSVENILAGVLELSVRYHSCNVRFLTLNHNLVKEQFQVGSLTGAVASQMERRRTKVSSERIEIVSRV